jgi:hypothetical protein
MEPGATGNRIAEASEPPSATAGEYREAVMTARNCSKVTCSREAVATLTYDYADSMAVLGPLAPNREPHSYDLCAVHAESLSAPQGWQVVRHQVVREPQGTGPDPLR